VNRRGFTLLEVMLAVSISAIGIVALLELFGGSARLARISSEQTEAVVLASSVMDSFLWRAELKEREYADKEGDYQWRASIRAVHPQLGATEDEPLEDISQDYELYEIVVDVDWGSMWAPRNVRLKTLRLMERF
jgi:prepilin-type N-terminal cleavage/methylation domain-containing protein